jgi:hypothetical protein
MHTTLIDSDACAPKDGGVDEEAQTHETPRGEKTRGDWGPFVLLVFVLLFVTIKMVENASALKSVRADVTNFTAQIANLTAQIKEFRVPESLSVGSDADLAYARELAMRDRPDDHYERDADADIQDAANDADADIQDDANDADADIQDDANDAFGDFVGELVVKYGKVAWEV